MFPRRSIYERISNSDPKIYGNLEHVFYAYKIHPEELPNIKDMYNIYNFDTYPKKTRIKQRPKDDKFDYFIINTMVGVGSKNKQKIRRVHVRFTIWPINTDIPEVEVLQIYPNYISRTIAKEQTFMKILYYMVLQLTQILKTHLAFYLQIIYLEVLWVKLE